MRKYFVLLTCLIIALGVVVLSNQPQVSAAQAGDLVKCDDFTTVYYLAEDGTRWSFPGEKVYFSWYDDFDDVVDISCTDLASYLIGGSVTYQPGTRLVKIQSIPKVYGVEPGGILRWLQTEADAEDLYGLDWASRVDDVDVGLWVKYTEGAELVSGEYPAGTIFKSQASSFYYYLWESGAVDRLTTGLLSNVQKEYAIDASHAYIAGLFGNSVSLDEWAAIVSLDQVPAEDVGAQNQQGDALYANGESCVADDECLSGFCNNFVCDELICSNDADCAANYYCDNNSCISKIAAGDSCSADNECLSDQCVNSVCVLDGGEACSYDIECESGACAAYGCAYECLVDSDCSVGYFCNQNDYCVLQLEVGETCSADSQCDTEICTNSLCVLDEGELCANDSECDSGICYDSVCSLACTDDADCQADEYCDNQTACTDTLEFAETCTRDGECTSETCSRFACIAAAGDDCTQNEDCVTGECGGDICSEIICTHDNECSNDYYCLNNFCHVKQDTAEACNGDNECLNNACQNGYCD